MNSRLNCRTMKFKKILLESAIENYKRDLEQYLDGRSEPYDFPYRPGATVSFSKGYMGDYGHVLNVEVFKGGQLAAKARVMEGRVMFYDSEENKIGVRDGGIPDPAKLFGRLLEIFG